MIRGFLHERRRAERSGILLWEVCMKQRIAVEQLNELTDEQKKRLREWWKPEDGDWAAVKAVL